MSSTVELFVLSFLRTINHIFSVKVGPSVTFRASGFNRFSYNHVLLLEQIRASLLSSFYHRPAIGSSILTLCCWGCPRVLVLVLKQLAIFTGFLADLISLWKETKKGKRGKKAHSLGRMWTRVNGLFLCLISRDLLLSPQDLTFWVTANIHTWATGYLLPPALLLTLLLNHE